MGASWVGCQRINKSCRRRRGTNTRELLIAYDRVELFIPRLVHSSEGVDRMEIDGLAFQKWKTTARCGVHGARESNNRHVGQLDPPSLLPRGVLAKRTPTTNETCLSRETRRNSGGTRVPPGNCLKYLIGTIVSLDTRRLFPRGLVLQLRRVSPRNLSTRSLASRSCV